MNRVERVVRGLTIDEAAEFERSAAGLAKLDSQPGAERMLAVYRDLQAKRLPPNVRVPARRKLATYLRVMGEQVGLPMAIRSLLAPGSWTSSGGSFKLAEAAGYDIPAQLIYQARTAGEARLLEVGAGYAGFKSEPPEGIAKLVEQAGPWIGPGITADFTNLTRWHDALPEGVTEHPYVGASEIGRLAIPKVDLIYSQCAAYFEPDIEGFIEGAAGLLKPGGILLFNDARPERVLAAAERNGLRCTGNKEFGAMNGTLYSLRRPEEGDR